MNSEQHECLWRPGQERVSSSNIAKFIKFINDKYSTSFGTYDELYEWSVTEIENFWSSLLEFSGIKLTNPYDEILKRKDSTVESALWFGGAELNFAENLLKYRDEHVALVHYYEGRRLSAITYSELHLKVTAFASALRSAGVKKGDRVAAYISNIPEAVIAMLAATSLGAIWSSTSPDFGQQGVIDRFGQIEPKVLVAVDGYFYNGKQFSIIDNVIQISEIIPAIEKVVIIPILNKSMPGSDKFCTWEEFITDAQTDDVEVESVPFNHPCYIMYSSGTTGVPKCIVHGAGGTLLQHYKELALHTNLKRQDVIMYYTTCGWMMWNWLVSSLQIGATVLLYEGSPVYPDNDSLWKVIEDEKVTIFGTSPKYLTACQKNGIVPKDRYVLGSLHTILSTGSPLSHENFSWVYKNVKSDIQLSSISGGTDIISCFMLGCPILPVYSEEIQCRGLGMKVEAWDENGNAMIDEKGELVCTQPFPSMPVYFWHDESGEIYHKAYFDFFPGIWRHGDFIRITSRGGVVALGRSDSTLNRAGVRIGTSEIYRIVESIGEILDSIVVAQKWNDDLRILLFVVMKPGFVLNDELKKKINHGIKTGLTPRHVPDDIVQIREVPITLNGKKVELAVTNILNGEEVKNINAIANPDSLKQFEKFTNDTIDI